MKKILIFLGLLLLCLFVGSVSAMSGNGDADNPWIITTPEDLTALSGTGLAGYGANAYYELGADIDMSEVANFEPIGTNSVRFAGHFDGKNHTITGMRIDLSTLDANIGLFLYVNGISNRIATVSNINFYNCYCSSGGWGGICISDVDYCTIYNINCYNCIVISTRTGNTGATGVIIGQATRHSNITVSDCSVHNCYIQGYSQVAGIIGNDYFAKNMSYNNCIVDKSTIYGLGYTLSGKSYSYVAGISGRFSTTINSVISNCTVSECSIIGTSEVGGVGV